MPRLFLPRWFVACALVMSVAVFVRAADSNAKTLITATDVLKVKQLESPALSPDGKSVIYVVRSMEPKPDAKDDWIYHTHLWLAATDGSAPPRRLTYGANQNSSPAWHPDGQRIAFVRAGTNPGERPQVHVLSLAGGEAVPLTKSETGAGNPRWSPDGAKLLFTSGLSTAQLRAALEKAGAEAIPTWPHEKPARLANDTANWKLKAGAKGKAAADGDEKNAPRTKTDPDGSLAEIREWLAKNESDANPRVTARYNFLSENDLQTDFTFAQLYVMEAREGAEAKPLALAYEARVAAEWMPDSRHIIYVAQRDPTVNPDRAQGRNSLFLVDVETATSRVFLAREDENYGNPTPSPDGQWIAYTFQVGGPFSFDQAKIAVIPTGGGEPRVLTPTLDRQAANPKWSRDSRAIYFTAPTNGRVPLYRVALDGGGGVQTLTWQQWGIRDFEVGADSLVQIVTHLENPYELHAAHLSGKVSKPLTRHNQEWLDGRKLAPVEEHTLQNEQGMTVHYWTMKPTEFDETKKYPLILNIHGGPTAMWGPGEDTTWFEFQFYAAKGYAQVFGNPRGSGGYGRDYQRANYRDWGTGPAADVLATATEAAKQPFIDPDRQVITGGSYGGYLTIWVIAHDHRFKAAISQRGVYDLITFYGEGNAWFLVPLYWGGYHWEPEIRALLLRDSPFTYAHQIKTPLLIKHGDVDFRTGVIQSQLLYKTLKALGRDVEYVRYPRATHELSRSGEPKQRLDRLVRYEEFFRRYVGRD